MERDYRFTNMKIVLIFMVVMGHFLQCLGESALRDGLHLYISAFNMPAFMFISGYFSKNTQKASDTAFEKYFLPFVCMSLIYFIYYPLITDSITFRFIKPVFAAWFILVLFYYKKILKYLVRIKNVFYISLAVALLAGMCPVITGKYALCRAIVMLPFFLAGYYTDKKTIDKICSCPKIVPALVMIAAGVGFYMFTAKFDFTIDIYINSTAYEIYGADFLEGIGIRMVYYVQAFVLTLCMCMLMPQKKYIFSYIGENTMGVYALHGIFYLYCKRNAVLEGINPSKGVTLCVVMSIIVVLLLSLPIVNRLFYRCVDLIKKGERYFVYGKEKHISKAEGECV